MRFKKTLYPHNSPIFRKWSSDFISCPSNCSVFRESACACALGFLVCWGLCYNVSLNFKRRGARWLFWARGDRESGFVNERENGGDRERRGEERETNGLVGLLMNAITSFDISERTSIKGLRCAIAVHFTNFCIWKFSFGFLSFNSNNTSVQEILPVIFPFCGESPHGDASTRA